MVAGKTETSAATARPRARAPDVRAVVARLKRLGTKATRAGMARFAIPSDKAFGVKVGDIRKVAKEVGRDHDLAESLWKTGIYEARMLAAFVAEPARVTPALMDRWCGDFDNWAVCDTACFHLFDRTPYAFDKIRAWADREPEFEKRAGFALLASIALHDKDAADGPFRASLRLCERAATDGRNFVKKSVVWALRGVAGRNAGLRAAALEVAMRLAASADAAPRWVGKTVLRELGAAAAKKNTARKNR